MKNTTEFNGNTNNFHNPPKRGSVGYWFHIVFFAFTIPFILVTIGTTMLLYQIFPLASLLGPLVGLVSAFYIARHSHRRMLVMDDFEYAQCFNLPSEPVDSMNPSDPSSQAFMDPSNQASPMYWPFSYEK